MVLYHMDMITHTYIWQLGNTVHVFYNDADLLQSVIIIVDNPYSEIPQNVGAPPVNETAYYNIDPVKTEVENPYVDIADFEPRTVQVLLYAY